MVFHDYGFGEHHGQPDAHPGVTRTIDEHVFKDDAFKPLLLAHTQFAFVKEGQDATLLPLRHRITGS